MPLIAATLPRALAGVAHEQEPRSCRRPAGGPRAAEARRRRPSRCIRCPATGSGTHRREPRTRRVEPGVLVERLAVHPELLADPEGRVTVPVHDRALACQPGLVVGRRTGQRGEEQQPAVPADRDRDRQPAPAGGLPQGRSPAPTPCRRRSARTPAGTPGPPARPAGHVHSCVVALQDQGRLVSVHRTIVHDSASLVPEHLIPTPVRAYRNAVGPHPSIRTQVLVGTWGLAPRMV